MISLLPQSSSFPSSFQWFGNLVTMRDWSELWLNEGFASFLVYEMLSARYPHLTEFEYFSRLAILFHKQVSLPPLPSLIIPSSQSGVDRPALVRSLSRESQVEAAFHTTHLYTKGCVVVRMIRDLVSSFDFSAGIKRFVLQISQMQNNFVHSDTFVTMRMVQ